MKIIRALRKKNVITKLNKINIVRCCHASFFMMVLAIVLVFADKLLIKDSDFLTEYWIYVLLGSILSIMLIASTYFISRLRQTRLFYRITSDIYIVGMEIILYLMANKALKSSNNTSLYILAVAFLAAVPVFYGVELYISIGLQLVLMIGFMVVYYKEPFAALTILICNLTVQIINYSKYEAVCNHIQLEERLYNEIKVSEHDPMTGLLNRRGMEKRIKAIYPLCRRYRIPVGVIMLDIDEFKKYNDCFGHPEGDTCIQMVSEILTETAKRTTDVIARVGGEEFLIFVQEIKKEDMVKLASRLQKNMEAMNLKHAPNASHKNVTISIGLAYANPREGVAFEELYEEADQALYLAKTSGRNCIGMNQGIVYWNDEPPQKAIAR